jgi:hypothetical protein
LADPAYQAADAADEVGGTVALELMALGAEPPATYAVTLQGRRRPRSQLGVWHHALQVGQPLPTLPLWLSEALVMPLELEATYEDTCLGLRIA